MTPHVHVIRESCPKSSNKNIIWEFFYEKK